ncbi:MAG: ECF-type sigma factor [Verrucomicrobiota bacterium]
MKRKLSGHSAVSHWLNPLGLRPIGLGILVVALNREIVWAASSLANPGRSSGPASEELVLLDPGAVGVTTASQPAVWSFDRPQGQIHRAGDAAGDAARTALGTRAAELVNLCFFVGLTQEHEAKYLGVPISTVERTWVYARAWLFRTVRGAEVL